MNTQWKTEEQQGHEGLHEGVIGQQRKLREFVLELRGWLYEVEQMGIPKFGETGYRLRQFRDSLSMHFETCVHDRWDRPNKDFEQQSTMLLKRLDDLIRQLEMLEPPFDSWEKLTQMLNDFSDSLEDLEHRFVDR